MNLVCEDLSFGYTSREMVLEHFSHEFAPGITLLTGWQDHTAQTSGGISEGTARQDHHPDGDEGDEPSLPSMRSILYVPGNQSAAAHERGEESPSCGGDGHAARA